MAITNTTRVLNHFRLAPGRYEVGTYGSPGCANGQRDTNDRQEVETPAWRHRSRFGPCAIVLVSLFCALAGHLYAQTQSPPERLTQAQIKAQYENCPSGYYSGPRPGKTRFAQDPWLWVVTPEFARRFCMPPEFVSAELKGAEAVAFRLLQKTDDVNCGFANNAQACFGQTVMRFDIYIRDDQKLPKVHDGTYFQSSRLPSAMLITKQPSEWKIRERYHSAHPQSALKFHFERNQVALQGIRNGVVVWPLMALTEETFFASVFEGIDYYAFEGASGNFRNPRMQKEGVKQFNVMFDKLGMDRYTADGSRVSEYAHAIELPVAFAARMAEADLARGTNYGQQIREAFKVGPVMPAASKSAK